MVRLGRGLKERWLTPYKARFEKEDEDNGCDAGCGCVYNYAYCFENEDETHAESVEDE